VQQHRESAIVSYRLAGFANINNVYRGVLERLSSWALWRVGGGEVERELGKIIDEVTGRVGGDMGSSEPTSISPGMRSFSLVYKLS